MQTVKQKVNVGSTGAVGGGGVSAKKLDEARKKWIAQVDAIRREGNLTVVRLFKAIMQGKKGNLWRHNYVGDAKVFEEFVVERFGIAATTLSKMREIVARFTEAEIESWGYEGCKEVCRLTEGSVSDKIFREFAKEFEALHEHPPSVRTIQNRVNLLIAEEHRKEPPPPESSTATRIRQRAMEADHWKERTVELETENVLLKQTIQTVAEAGVVVDSPLADVVVKPDTGSTGALNAVVALAAKLSTEELVVLRNEVDRLLAARLTDVVV